jgi:hypothetical protein
MATASLLLALFAAPPGAPELRGAAAARACVDPPPLARLDGCVPRECRDKEFDEAELQSGPADAGGEFDQAFVQGKTAVVTYVCAPTLPLDAIARRAQAALRRSGYTMVYAGGMALNDLPGFTARKGRHWIQVVSEPFDARSGYTVTSVHAEAVEPPERPRARRTGRTPPSR